MPNFFFQRYVHGERMADDVLITKQPTLEAAIPEALRLCRNSPKSVLVYVSEDNALSEEITRLREENARLEERNKKLNADLLKQAELTAVNMTRCADLMPAQSAIVKLKDQQAEIDALKAEVTRLKGKSK